MSNDKQFPPRVRISDKRGGDPVVLWDSYAQALPEEEIEYISAEEVAALRAEDISALKGATLLLNQQEEDVAELLKRAEAAEARVKGLEVAVRAVKESLEHGGAYIVEEGFEEPEPCVHLRVLTNALEGKGGGA